MNRGEHNSVDGSGPFGNRDRGGLVIGAMKRFGARRVLTASATLLLVGAGLTTATVSAGAATTVHHPSKTAVVVEQRAHAPFGKILYPTKRHALYYLKSGSTCTGECLAIWPRLLMPKGKTIPKGASCLGTAKVGKRLQVTYNRHRLYTFVDDSGTSVTGNNVAGFVVAKIVKKCK
jgi:predicted lipoprotein with Yx(FWY)xxD motif